MCIRDRNKFGHKMITHKPMNISSIPSYSCLKLRKIHYSNVVVVLFFGFLVKFIKLELALLLIRPTHMKPDLRFHSKMVNIQIGNKVVRIVRACKGTS